MPQRNILDSVLTLQEMKDTPWAKTKLSNFPVPFMVSHHRFHSEVGFFQLLLQSLLEEWENMEKMFIKITQI